MSYATAEDRSIARGFAKSVFGVDPVSLVGTCPRLDGEINILRKEDRQHREIIESYYKGFDSITDGWNPEQQLLSGASQVVIDHGREGYRTLLKVAAF